jgi:hypothetical protein
MRCCLVRIASPTRHSSCHNHTHHRWELVGKPRAKPRKLRSKLATLLFIFHLAFPPFSMPIDLRRIVLGQLPIVFAWRHSRPLIQCQLYSSPCMLCLIKAPKAEKTPAVPTPAQSPAAVLRRCHCTFQVLSSPIIKQSCMLKEKGERISSKTLGAPLPVRLGQESRSVASSYDSL